MVAFEARGDADAVGTLELVRLARAWRTRLLLVLAVAAVAETVAHSGQVDARVAAVRLVGLARERVGWARPLICNKTPTLAIKEVCVRA